MHIELDRVGLFLFKRNPALLWDFYIYKNGLIHSSLFILSYILHNIDAGSFEGRFISLPRRQSRDAMSSLVYFSTGHICLDREYLSMVRPTMGPFVAHSCSAGGLMTNH